METIDIKLKPCPFCGSTARLYVSYDSRYVVQCGYCHIGTIHMKNKQKAIELWNHRTKVLDDD